MNAEHIETNLVVFMQENQQILQLINLFDNQQGEILSAGRVDIVNPDLTLVVNNALGKN